MNTSSIFTTVDNPNKLESYSLERILGSGSRSVVYLATCTRGRLHGRKVAIKAFAVSQDMFVSETLSNTATRSLHHPALISIHSSFTTSGFHYYVLELCERGRICELLSPSLDSGPREMRPHFPLPEAQLRPILRRIVEGVAHLHSRDIVHGDIRPHNIFITGDGRIKLALRPLNLRPKADQKPELLHNILCKKSNYNAPELAANEPCSFSSDLWSLGCLMVTFLTGVCEFEYIEYNGSTGLPAKMILSPQAQDLTCGLLKIDPQHRTPLKKVLSHAFLNPSLPSQSFSIKKLLSDFREADNGSQKIESDFIETQGGSVPSAFASSNDRSKQDPDSIPSGPICRMSTLSTSETTATVKATEDRLNASSRPRLYSTSSTQLSSGIQDTWKRLSSRQQLENRCSERSKSPAVAEVMKIEAVPLKRERKPLGEVGNLKRPSFNRNGASKESAPKHMRGSKELSSLPSGLVSPPETHLGQSLPHEGRLCDSEPIPPAASTSSEDRGIWQRHSRRSEVLLAPSEHPVPIPRINCPKSLQVAPLFPQTHKIAHGQLVILPSRNLLVDLREGDRRAGGRGDRVLCVAPDGQEIKVYDAPHLSTPCVLSEPRETWILDELPERYWQSYTFASKYLESVKKRTPWMVWYTPHAKFTVMSNGPKGDIHSSFPCPPHGLKEQRHVSSELSGSFVKMEIKFSRQQDILELSRYAPSSKQTGRGEWISKSETITVERLKVCDDLMLSMTPEERQGLVCLIEGVKLAEAAEEIYMVARPRIEEKDFTLDDIADYPLKPDEIATMVSTPQLPEAPLISDIRQTGSTPTLAQSEIPLSIALRRARTSAGTKTAVPVAP